MTFSFDEENHLYHHNLARLPGATDIVKSEGLIDTDFMTEDCRWRGKAIHEGIKLINHDDLDWDTVEPVVAGYLRSYETFLKHSGFKVVGCEVPFMSTALACCCIPDVFGYLNNRLTVVELKSYKVPAWAAIQTMIQKLALQESGFAIERRFGLELKADGRISNLIPFEDRNDEYLTKSMAATFHWKVAKGYIKDWNQK
jgi:hypothetical protein